MKKNTKKLLSMITAGLFVLQSVPFMALGATAVATTADVLQYVPTLDGTKDAAYEESYTYTMDGGSMSMVYDADYLYVYGEVTDSTIGDSDYVEITSVSNDSTAFWSDGDVYRIAPNGSGTILFSWRDGGSNNTANAALADTEFVVVTSEAGYAFELRIAKAVALTEGRADIDVGMAINNDATITGLEWAKVYNSGAFGGGETITLGATYEPDDTTVKKGTPVIDGVMENIWYDTAYVSTLADAKNGNGVVGWNVSETVTGKLVEAGLLDDASDTTINPDGDFTTGDYLYADTYFMWDEGNLYVFSKVYDNDIVLQTDADQKLDMVDIADMVGNSPWLSEVITHNITHNGQLISAYAHPAGACWDTQSCGDDGTHAVGVCDNSTGSSLLHCYNHTSADVHKADRNNYLGIEINRDAGYYTLELCIPLSENYAASLLQDGAEFTYDYLLCDGYKKAIGTSFQDLATTSQFMQYTGAKHTLSISTTEAVAPACAHEWNTEPTVINAATCIAEGSQNYRCSLCGDVKPGSTEVVPALGHDYVDGTCTRCGEKQPKVVYKYTPTLDGVMDDQYLGSAALTFEELVADEMFGVVNWLTDNTSIGKLADAGLIELEKDADGNYAKNSEGYYTVTNGLITTEDDITNEYLTKTDSYFLWDSEAIYIYSKVYDNDPLNVDIAFADSGTDLYDGIGVDRPWLNDVLTHTINPENNPYAVIDVSGMAYGNAIWDGKGDGWSTISDFSHASGTLRRLEAKDNLAVTVNEEEGWYAIEMRIPISDKDFGGTPLNESFLQDGKQFTYNYTVTDGYKKALGSSFSGYQATAWTRSGTNTGTVFQLSETVAEAPHIHELSEVTVVTEATCTVEGAGTQKCATCEEVIDVVIPALGHDIITDAAVEATCTTDGLTEGSYCSRCEDATVAQEVVPALGHADEDGDNACDNCGESLGIPGDITGDGKVDVKDLTRLMKIIAGDETAVAAVNPDVTGDGKVDVKDLTRLMKAIAGDEVELH